MEEAILTLINKCTDSSVLKNVQNAINKRLVELSDNDEISTLEKIYKLSTLAKEYDSCIPSNKDKNSPEELLTNFVDMYMYRTREKPFDYVNIINVMNEMYNDDGIELRNGKIMTDKQYESVLEFVYNEVKNGTRGFIWDW